MIFVRDPLKECPARPRKVAQLNETHENQWKTQHNSGEKPGKFIGCLLMILAAYL